MTLFSKRELLVALVPGADGKSALQYAQVDGRRIIEVGKGDPVAGSGAMRAALYSPASYFERVEVSAPSPKLLPLAARRHLDAELVFDEAYRLRARCRVKRERTITGDLAAMPEPDLDTATALLPLAKRPCCQMVPMELAIAALVTKATSQPLIVMWEKGGVLVYMLVTDGAIQVRNRDNVNDENRDVVMARAEASLRANAGHHGERADDIHTLLMGDLCAAEAKGRAEGVAAIESHIAKLYRGRRGIDRNIVLQSPELFGLPFVDEEWNFLEKAYRDQVQSWRYARPAAAAAGVVGVAFALLGGVQHLQAMSASSDFAVKQADLRQTLVEIKRVKPSDAAMAAVRDSLQIKVQSQNEVRLDRLLGWLTHQIPEGVSIRRLVVEPEPPPRRGGKPEVVKYSPGQKPFLVNMEIVLAETAFDAAEASSAELVRRLSRGLDIVNSRLAVPAPEPGAARNVVLVVNAEAKAVRF